MCKKFQIFEESACEFSNLPGDWSPGPHGFSRSGLKFKKMSSFFEIQENSSRRYAKMVSMYDIYYSLHIENNITHLGNSKNFQPILQ